VPLSPHPSASPFHLSRESLCQHTTSAMPPTRGSRLQRYLHDHPSRWVALLEVMIKSLNTLLILAGFGVVGCCLLADADADRPLPLPARLLAAADAAALRPAALALGAAGGLAVVAASAGLAATSLRSPQLLSFSTVLLSVLLAAELCLAVAAYEGSASGRLDPSGFRPQLRQLLGRFRVFFGVAAGDQVLATVHQVLLQSAYTSADEAAEDMEDDLASTRPLLR
jgi:hypothetical protein